MNMEDKGYQELVGRLEDACLEMTNLLSDIHNAMEVLSSEEIIDAIRARKGEKAIASLILLVSDTEACVADATKSLAFIVKWIQCLKGESNACSPDYLEKVRLAAFELTTAFEIKRFIPSHFELQHISRYITPFNEASSLATTISLYIDETPTPSPALFKAVEILSEEPKDLIEKFNKLAQEILYLVNLLINKFVLAKINSYLKQSLHKTAEEHGNEIPEELLEEEL